MSQYSSSDEHIGWTIAKFFLLSVWRLIKWLFRTPVPGWGILLFLAVTVFLPFHPILELVLAVIAISGLYYWLFKKPAGQRTLARIKDKAEAKIIKNRIYGVMEAHRLYDPETDARPYIDVTVTDIGFDVLVQTPYGKSDKAVENLQDELAAEFRAENVQVGRTETAGDTQFYIVIDDPLREALTDTWPGEEIIKAGPSSVADPVPVARNSKGDVVRLPLYYSSILGAGLPRHGKSVALWEILLFMANDPKAKIYVVDLKGGVELNAITPRADAFCTSKEQALELFQKMLTEMDKRYEDMLKKGLRKAPADHPDYQPLILVIDEMAELFFGTGPQVKEMDDILIRLLSKGPAAGIVVAAFTQRTSIDDIGHARSRFSYRWSMRVDNATSASLILGAAAVEEGAVPHLLPSANSGGAGLGYLVDEVGDVVRCRSWYLDDDKLDELVSIVAERRKAYLDSHTEAEVDLANDIDYQEAQDMQLAAEQAALNDIDSAPVVPKQKPSARKTPAPVQEQKFAVSEPGLTITPDWEVPAELLKPTADVEQEPQPEPDAWSPRKMKPLTVSDDWQKLADIANNNSTDDDVSGEVDTFLAQLNSSDFLAEQLEFPSDVLPEQPEPKPESAPRKHRRRRKPKPVPVEQQLDPEAAAEPGTISVEELIERLPLTPTFLEPEND